MFFVLSRAWDKEKVLSSHEESNLWIPRSDALPKLKQKLLSLSVKNVVTLNDLISRACRATLAFTQRTCLSLLCFVLAKYCFP